MPAARALRHVDAGQDSRDKRGGLVCFLRGSEGDRHRNVEAWCGQRNSRCMTEGARTSSVLTCEVKSSLLTRAQTDVNAYRVGRVRPSTNSGVLLVLGLLLFSLPESEEQFQPRLPTLPGKQEQLQPWSPQLNQQIHSTQQLPWWQNTQTQQPSTFQSGYQPLQVQQQQVKQQSAIFSSASSITTPQLAVTGGGMGGAWGGAPTLMQATPAMHKQKALIVADPLAPSPLSSFADGKGLSEAELGKVARFHVVARDMYGDSHQCDPDSFVVNVVHTAAFDDDGHTDCKQSVSQKCTTCKGTTVCYEGLSDGKACKYTFTPHASGFFRVTILTPSQTSDQLLDIQGSPFQVHVDDGGFMLPGVSVGGYLLFFFISVAGGVALVSLLFCSAWTRYSTSQIGSDYVDEMRRLEELAAGLEETARRRSMNGFVMSQLPVIMQAMGGAANNSGQQDGGESCDDNDTSVDVASIDVEPAESPQSDSRSLLVKDPHVLSHGSLLAQRRRHGYEHASPASKLDSFGGRGRDASKGEAGARAGKAQREVFLSEAVYKSISGLADMATPVKVVREMLVDDDDGGTALEMQEYGPAAGGGASGGGFVEFSEDLNELDDFEDL